MMQTYRRSFLLGLMFFLTFFLAACGDDGSSLTIPSYSGGRSIAVTDQLKSAFASQAGNKLKINSLTAFKTSDSPDKVKAFFNDGLKKAGWEPTTDQQLQDVYAKLGGFGESAKKGTREAVVGGVSGSAAQSAFGYNEKDVAATDVLYFVLDGTNT